MVSSALSDTPGASENKRPHLSKDKSVVTIIASKEKFVIHKEFISHYSKYFDHAFKREFIEGKTREMDFPHVNPSIFGMISHWLYTQQLCHPTDDLELTVRELVDLWLLGEKWRMPKLQNSVMELTMGRSMFFGLSYQDKRYVIDRAYESVEETVLQKRITLSVMNGIENNGGDISATLHLFPEKMVRQIVARYGSRFKNVTGSTESQRMVEFRVKEE